MALRHKTFILMLALTLAAGFGADAFARAGGGGSFGSRGSMTFSRPSSTMTAPGGGSAFQRSWTSPGASPNQGIFRPGAGAARARGGMFGGFGGGLMGGLLGAGLIGMLLGHGFGGGLGGGMSFIGLLLQLALLYFLFKFVMGLLRGRSPAQRSAHTGAPPSGAAPPFGGYDPGSGGGFGGFGGGAQQPQKLDVGPTDYSAFEQLLGAVQKAYSDEDLNALRAMTTPEMASWFADDLAENARRGVINKLSNVAFLQGDLTEAWREANAEYASVAMRFSLNDAMLDRATGRVVSGDLSTPQQATEIWTFARRPGGGAGDWKLSAIQQAAQA
jgi:predicted lipid-binding transport protein (Tim44 family)